MDISKLELWELWKLKCEQLALLMQTQANIAAIDAELAKREKENQDT